MRKAGVMLGFVVLVAALRIGLRAQQSSTDKPNSTTKK
jgi:hypothetical protein